jgi:2,3-bisphosphoglycerate-independent phosphoglycerate mutase
VVVGDDGAPVGTIEDGDAVLLFNFRGDRAVELVQAFEADDFPHFERGRRPDVFFAGMMRYDGDRGLPQRYLVGPSSIEGTMGERLAVSGVRQLAISETQKYGHVTYFWNGNRSDPFDAELEDYVEIPSDNVPFEQRPWMKAAEITDEAIARLRADPDIKFARINYPNGDMVGHTGDLQAAIVAVEAVDLCLARLLEAIERLGGAAIVTADHGNADQMIQIDKKSGDLVHDDRGRPVPMTAHTLNVVPCWIWAPSIQPAWALAELETRRLSHLATTALALMGYEAPAALDPPLIRPA